MIIRYPTGAYENIINDNVTWVISSEDPPQSIEKFNKLPIAEERKTVSLNYNKLSYRSTLGELVFSVQQSSPSDVGSSRSHFVVGDVLDFNTGENLSINIAPSNKIETRHDVNIVDYKSAGLSDEEINKIRYESKNKKDILDMEFKNLMYEIANIESTISELQKSVNETQKAINAVEILGDKDILLKLNNNKIELEKNINELIKEYNEKTELSESIKNNIRSISRMII